MNDLPPRRAMTQLERETLSIPEKSAVRRSWQACPRGHASKNQLPNTLLG